MKLSTSRIMRYSVNVCWRSFLPSFVVVPSFVRCRRSFLPSFLPSSSFVVAVVVVSVRSYVRTDASLGGVGSARLGWDHCVCHVWVDGLPVVVLVGVFIRG